MAHCVSCTKLMQNVICVYARIYGNEDDDDDDDDDVGKRHCIDFGDDDSQTNPIKVLVYDKRKLAMAYCNWSAFSQSLI